METVTTQQGRRVTLLSWKELIDPLDSGLYVRAYCPIHQGENQRSLSIHRASGWGRCFNASCLAFGLPGERSTILVVEWNPEAATRLSSRKQIQLASLSLPSPEQQNHIPSRLPPQWQQTELAVLHHLYCTGFLRRALCHPWAQAYLEARHIPLEVARTSGVGYLPAASDLPFDVHRDTRFQGMSRWCQRIIFPLGVLWSDQVVRMGFIGRTIYGWRAGIDENEHKALIDEYDRVAQAQGRPSLRRWCKTNPAGWFGYEPARFDTRVVVVEGAFDRLALLASGWSPTGVVALSGTAAQPGWFPAHVRVVVLALDADAGGMQVAPKLGHRLTQAGFQVVYCHPPQDALGKDWSERWSRVGRSGVLPLYEACARFPTSSE